jgi:hypothetical protein
MLSRKCFDAIEKQFKGLIAGHEADIHAAYLNKEEDEKLSIRLGISLYPHKERFQVTVVETTLAFTKEKVRDSLMEEVDEKQNKLPLGEKS